MSRTVRIDYFVKSSLSSLSPPQRRRLFLLTLLRTVLIAVDLLAVFLLAIGISSLSDSSGVDASATLGIAALLVLVRSITTLIVSRATFRFLAEVEVEVGGRFTETIFSAPQELLDAFRSQDLAFALNQGTNSLTSRTLGFLVIVVSDGFALISLVTVFLSLYPLEGSILVALVVMSVLPVQRSVGRRIHESSSVWADATVNMMQQIQEFQASRREIFLNSASKVMANRLNGFRQDAANASARFNFMLTVPRTIIEIATLSITALLLLVAYWRLPSNDFVLFAAMLTAITFRIAPLGIGIIGALGVIAQSKGETHVNRRLINQIEIRSLNTTAKPAEDEFELNTLAVSLEKVSYCFPGSNVPVVRDVTIQIASNEVVALVGPSGTGKTTLLECITGIREATSGHIRIFGKTLEVLHSEHPGFFGLVTQSPALSRGTLAENIALFSGSEIDKERVSRLAHEVGLGAFISRTPIGIDTPIGEGVLQLSGGEKQRLSIARALYSDPKILVMDEPTSALDGLSEEQVFDLITAERRKRTILIVTHRRPSSFAFDSVYEMSHGTVRQIEE